jgi:hypothetical protein
LKPIEDLSLGWRTDLIFPRFDAQVITRDDHLLVRTPHNPTFYWGNFLLYDHAPRESDAASWLASFDAEISRPQPQSRHIAFGVDAPEAFELPASFVQAGLTSHVTTVLTMKRDQLRAPLSADSSMSPRTLHGAGRGCAARSFTRCAGTASMSWVCNRW